VIALHCSGSSSRQWNKLASALGDRFRFHAPDLIGSVAAGRASAMHDDRLAEETARIVALVDREQAPVHLVGHSYGGAVALRVARERPGRIASLSLYEPVAFHVLRTLGMLGRAALGEIQAVAREIACHIAYGGNRAAALRFVEYWGGEGAWSTMRPDVQDEVVRYVPHAPVEFSSVLAESPQLLAYRRFGFPILLMCGGRSPEPVVLIVRKLFSAMRGAVMTEISDAGHMGPLSHADRVNAAIADHMNRAHSADPFDHARNDNAFDSGFAHAGAA
jgi:pimeloyl-ACP methyl ester carboxylesterase